MAANSSRLVVVGRNSSVWARVKPYVGSSAFELSHEEVEATNILPTDIVWILSYSRSDEDNRRLLSRLAAAGARQTIYVSSATAITGDKYRCYSYPRSKFHAEIAAVELLRASIVRFGVVYEREDELPGGVTLATSLEAIARAMQKSLRSGPQTIPRDLFEPVNRPFRSVTERLAYAVYTTLVQIVPTPCLLRPLDLLLRMLGWNWYGYVFLSNRQWLTTT